MLYENVLPPNVFHPLPKKHSARKTDIQSLRDLDACFMETVLLETDCIHMPGWELIYTVNVQRMHVPPHMLGMLKPVFKKLAEANRGRSMVCSLLASSTTEATEATAQAVASSPLPPAGGGAVVRPVSL